VTGRVEFANAAQADNAARVPGAKRIDGRTVEISAENVVEAYRAFRAAASLGRG